MRFPLFKTSFVLGSQDFDLENVWKQWQKDTVGRKELTRQAEREEGGGGRDGEKRVCVCVCVCVCFGVFQILNNKKPKFDKPTYKQKSERKSDYQQQTEGERLKRLKRGDGGGKQ